MGNNNNNNKESNEIKGIFFRSDTRHPTEEPHAIFVNGFTKRNAKDQDPVLRFPTGPKTSPDIVPSSAVCFTRDFKAAPLFPVSDLEAESWVYVLDVDVSNGKVYNTQKVQWEYVSDHKLLEGKVFDEASEILWTMFGQERAANEVAARDIVGAVHVSRAFTADNVFQGGTFTCLEYISNPGYAASNQDLVRSTMESYVGESVTMPTRDEGFHPSTGR